MDLLDKYIIARWAYAIGVDFIDDVEYRYLENAVKEKYPTNEYLSRSWSDDPCPIELLKKYDRMDLYRDIKFAYKSESIRSINSEQEFVSQFSSLNEKSRLSFKEDGFNIQVNYYNGEPISAETRGRKGNSLNANTVLALVPKRISILGKVKITGECVVPKDKWKAFQELHSNVSQRSSVSTCLAQGLTQYLEYVAFNIQAENRKIEDIYSTLDYLGFHTPVCMWVSNMSELVNGVKVMGRWNENYNIPTDGLVIENSKYQLAIRVGDWQESVLKSYVTGYAENVGMHGVAMLAKIAPVKSSEGHTYTSVSVTNLQYILDNDLQIGSPIAFDLRSMAVPVLNTTATKDLHDEYSGRYEEYKDLIDSAR